MSRRSRSAKKRSQQRIGALVVVVVLLVIIDRLRDDRSSAPAPQPHPSGAPAVSGRVNPIERMLRTASPADRRAGVAAAILVDVSGSMSDDVTDRTGRQRPKIVIARQCVRRLVQQADAFTDEHPDQPLLLGIYEFSSRRRGPVCRRLVPLGRPDVEKATEALQRMRPDGGTPIGDAIIRAKRDLDATGLDRLHLLVITDGENTQGYDPSDVAEAMNRLAPAERPALYFIAFDIAAERFAPVRDAGGLVLAAANEQELERTLGYVLTGKILVEQPEEGTGGQRE